MQGFRDNEQIETKWLPVSHFNLQNLQCVVLV